MVWTHGFPHLGIAEGTFRIDASFSVYQDFNGEFNVDFFGTTQHYSQAMGESIFTAKTSLIVDGKQVGKTQVADFGPGQSVITVPNVGTLGFTKTRLPHLGRKVRSKYELIPTSGMVNIQGLMCQALQEHLMFPYFSMRAQYYSQENRLF